MSRIYYPELELGEFQPDLSVRNLLWCLEYTAQSRVGRVPTGLACPELILMSRIYCPESELGEFQPDLRVRNLF